MRSTKDASVVFGVWNIPVGVCPATTTKDAITFSNLHDRKEDGTECNTPVKQPRTCVTCHADDLQPDDLVKGYKIAKDTYVRIENEEIKSVEAARSPIITIDKFVSALTFETDLIKKSYYLLPQDHFTNNYSIFMYAMEDTHTVAFGHSSLWGKDAPFVIESKMGVLVFSTLYTNAEIVHPDFLVERPNSEFVEMTKATIEEWTDELLPTDLVSNPDLAVKALIEAKVSGVEFSPPAVEEAPVPSIDIQEVLEKTMALAPKRRSKVKV